MIEIILYSICVVYVHSALKKGKATVGASATLRMF